MALFDMVKELCKKHGITQAELEKRCGFSKGSISKWKAHAPTIGSLARVAEVFGVPVDYLYNGTYTSADSAQTSAGSIYYDDPEKAQIAQRIFEDKNLRLLFEATEGSRPEDIQMAADMLTRFKEARGE